MPATAVTLGLTRSTGDLLRRGRQLLENFLFRKHTDIASLQKHKAAGKVGAKDKGEVQNVGVASGAAPLPTPAAVHRPLPGRTPWSDGLGAYLARTTTRTLAAHLRRKAALQFWTRTPVVRRAYGGRTPLYAFVGLGMFGGLREDHDETPLQEESFGQVCTQIKALFNPKEPMCLSNHCDTIGSRLDDYQFGPLIAKGCNSAVYSARLRDTHTNYAAADWNDRRNIPMHTSVHPSHPVRTPLDTITEDSDDDNSSLASQSLASLSDQSFCIISDPDSDEVMNGSRLSLSGSDITILDGVKEDMDLLSDERFSQADIDDEQDLSPDARFPLAMKMMFNYDAESNATAIFRTMQNEAVPAKLAEVNSHMSTWESGNHVKKKRLKPHPNIVDMFGVFVDDVPQMPDALEEYPDALPCRLYSDGCGRNKTMFIVMKRYGVTLRDYLADNLPTARESTLMLCQLMEALLHMNTQGIAHRDLKSDNILLDGDVESPHLVVTDFGCCLADINVGLRVPYFSDDVTRGGNRSLMAPEIATAHPGHGCYLDYRKSDMWAAGALIYELFGAENPFYYSSAHNRGRLDSRTYRSKMLPKLPVHAPRYMYWIMRSMLRWSPSKRPAMHTVVNALHLLLWGPAEWRFSLELKRMPPSKVEVIHWLLSFTTDVLIERGGQQTDVTDRVEHVMQCQFLARLSFDDVMDAIHYLWSLR